MGVLERMRNVCGKKGVGLKGTTPFLYKDEEAIHLSKQLEDTICGLDLMN